MKRNSIFALTLILSIQFLLANAGKEPKVKPVAVTKGNDTITLSSGLRYVITQKNPNGILAANGDKVEAHYTGTLTNGKKFDSSRDRNETFSFTLGKGEVIQGWDQGFAMIREGEKATFIIPPHLGYGSQDMGPDLPANSTLIFDVELVKVHKPVPYIPYDGGKDTITLASGLRYIIIDKGDVSNKADSGKTAHIYYAGYLLNGFKFDSNFGTVSPIVLPVITNRVIKGWQEMLPLVNKGMKIRLIIPPALGYGAREIPNLIPANSVLIFDMFIAELL